MGFIWLDVVIYNFLMILINIFHSIPLIKPYLDITLNSIEQRVYDNVFAKNIDKRTCKRILDSGKLMYIADKNFITQQGSIYTGVYLVAHMKKTHQLVFIENNQEIFREDKAYTWMGLIEYDMMRKAQLKKEASFKWPISIFLDSKKNSEIVDDDKFEKAYPEALYVYFFEFEKLQKLYTDENGIFVRNALHSVWLEAMCHKIIEIDMKVSKFLGKAKPLTSERRLSQEKPKDDEREHKLLKSNLKEDPLIDEDLHATYNTEDKLISKKTNSVKNNNAEMNILDNEDHDKDCNNNERKDKQINYLDKPFNASNEDSLEKKNTYLQVKNDNDEDQMAEEDSALSAFQVHDQDNIN